MGKKIVDKRLSVHILELNADFRSAPDRSHAPRRRRLGQHCHVKTAIVPRAVFGIERGERRSTADASNSACKICFIYSFLLRLQRLRAGYALSCSATAHMR